MGLVDGFKSASIFGKIALILLAVALLFIYIAFTTTGWGEENRGNTYTHIGLWRRCDDDDYSANCSELDGWALDWFASVQALVIFGFVGINVAFFLVCLLLFTSQCGGNKEVGIGAAIVCLVTGILLLIGCILFAVKFDYVYVDKLPSNQEWELSYGFGLALVACLLEIIAGVLLLVDSLKKGSSQSPIG